MQKVIGLIGYVNKVEYIINLAKVLNIMGNNVLVIDGTVEEKTRYTIPSFDKKEKEHLTHFDGVDYAVGFNSIEKIKEYICTKTSNADDYDYILIDIDNAKFYEDFKADKFSRIYFFSEYTNISLAKNEELIQTVLNLKAMDEELEITKVIFRYYVTRASEKYFDQRLNELGIKFSENIYELQYSDQDRIADIEGEQSGYIDITRHTKQFISVVTDMASEITGESSGGEIRKAIKMYTRGRL